MSTPVVMFPIDEEALIDLGFSHGSRKPLQCQEDADACRRADAKRPYFDPFWIGKEEWRERLGIVCPVPTPK